MSMTDQTILDHIKQILSENFEIDPERVHAGANLFTEFDLDSIDAVELAIGLQKLTGRRIQPQDFKEVRTVGDVIAAVQQLLAA
ncbi:acyl carrier protein [Leeia sp.]|uniref:acyl carrier protein n=1 Tax=Leeia sp. TaxID=2884678 RepID=UPI0035AE107E